MGGLVSAVGISGGLASALTAGLTNAGFGALLGGSKGALMGAASGLLGMPAIGGAPATQGPQSLLDSTPYAQVAPAPGSLEANFDAEFGVGAGGQQAVANAAMGAPPASGGGGLLGNLDPFTKSSLISGLGRGLSAQAESDERKDLREERYANQSLDGSLLDPSVANQAGAKEFNPYDVQPKWTYDPAQGKMVRIG